MSLSPRHFLFVNPHSPYRDSVGHSDRPMRSPLKISTQQHHSRRATSAPRERAANHSGDFRSERQWSGTNRKRGETHECKGSMHRGFSFSPRHHLAMFAESGMKSPGAEPTGSYFERDGTQSEQGVSRIDHNEPELSHEERPPVNVEIVERSLLDNCSVEDMSVITEYTEHPTTRYHSQQGRPKQFLPLPRIPAGNSNRGGVRNHFDEPIIQSTTEDSGFDDDPLWHSNRRIDPDASTLGDSNIINPFASTINDPPEYCESNDERGKLSIFSKPSFKRPDAPAISSRLAYTNKRNDPCDSSTFSRTGKIDAPQSVDLVFDAGKSPLFTLGTTSTTTTEDSMEISRITQDTFGSDKDPLLTQSMSAVENQIMFDHSSKSYDPSYFGRTGSTSHFREQSQEKRSSIDITLKNRSSLGGDMSECEKRGISLDPIVTKSPKPDVFSAPIPLVSIGQGTGSEASQKKEIGAVKSSGVPKSPKFGMALKNRLAPVGDMPVGEKRAMKTSSPRASAPKPNTDSDSPRSDAFGSRFFRPSRSPASGTDSPTLETAVPKSSPEDTAAQYRFAQGNDLSVGEKRGLMEPLSRESTPPNPTLDSIVAFAKSPRSDLFSPFPASCAVPVPETPVPKSSPIDTSLKNTFAPAGDKADDEKRGIKKPSRENITNPKADLIVALSVLPRSDALSPCLPFVNNNPASATDASPKCETAVPKSVRAEDDNERSKLPLRKVLPSAKNSPKDTSDACLEKGDNQEEQKGASRDVLLHARNLKSGDTFARAGMPFPKSKLDNEGGAQNTNESRCKAEKNRTVDTAPDITGHESSFQRFARDPHQSKQSEVPIDSKIVDSGAKQVLLMRDHSVVEELKDDLSADTRWKHEYARHFANGLHAGAQSVGDVTGLRDLLCCGTYAGQNASDLTMPRYPFMPHHSAAMVHVMETIQETDTIISSKSERWIQDKVWTPLDREESPIVLHELTETDSDSDRDSLSTRKCQSLVQEKNAVGLVEDLSRTNTSTKEDRLSSSPAPPGHERYVCEQESISILSPSKIVNLTGVPMSGLSRSSGAAKTLLNGGNGGLPPVDRMPTVAQDEKVVENCNGTVGGVYQAKLNMKASSNLTVTRNERDLGRPPSNMKSINAAEGTRVERNAVVSDVLDSTAVESVRQADSMVTISLSSYGAAVEDFKVLPEHAVESTQSSKSAKNEYPIVTTLAASHFPDCPGMLSLFGTDQNAIRKEVVSDKGTSNEIVQEVNTEEPQAGPRSGLFNSLFEVNGYCGKGSCDDVSKPLPHPTNLGNSETHLTTLRKSAKRLLQDDDSAGSNDSSHTKGASTTGGSTAYFDAEDSILDGGDSFAEDSSFTNHGTMPPLPPIERIACAPLNSFSAGRRGRIPAAVETVQTPCSTSTENFMNADTPKSGVRSSSGVWGADLQLDILKAFLAGEEVEIAPGCRSPVRSITSVGDALSLGRPPFGSSVVDRASEARRQSSEVLLRKNLTQQASPKNVNKKVNVHICAILLQRRVRGMLAMKAFRRNIACVVTIQCAVRRWFALRLLAIMKIVRRINLHALTIQRCCRRWLAVRTVWRLKHLIDLAVRCQALTRRFQAVKKLKTAKQRAVKIQAFYRAKVSLEKFQVSKSSSVIIQKSFRSFFMTKKFRASRGAAIAVQRVWKRLYKRKISAVNIQTAWRSYYSRKMFKKASMAAVMIQAFTRCFLESRKFRSLKLAALRSQAIRRGTTVRRSFSQMRRQVYTCQGLARIWIARRRARIRKRSLITIQAYERRRQAREILRGAKIAWQIETAFSSSSNPATMPALFSCRPVFGTPAILDADSEDYTPMKKPGFDDVDASTLEYETSLHSSCPPVAVLLNERQEPPTFFELQDETRLLIKKFLPKVCHALNVFGHSSGLNACAHGSGSGSFDESILPNQINSELSGNTSVDDFSTRDYTSNTRTSTAKSYSSGSVFNSKFHAAIRESCEKVLGCVDAEDLHGDLGEETSSVGADENEKKKTETNNPEKSGRGLGGIRIAFADTIEYEEDAAKADSQLKQSGGKLVALTGKSSLPSIFKHTAEIFGSVDETRQEGDEPTVTESTADTNDSGSLRCFETCSAPGESPNPLTDLLESALDYVCVTPSGVMQFWGNQAHPPSQRPIEPEGSPPQRVVQQESSRSSSNPPKRHHPRSSPRRHGKKPSIVYPRTPVTIDENSNLLTNDQLFHVLASMLVEHFQAKLTTQNMLILQPEDKHQIELLLPEWKRADFVRVVQQRVAVLPSQSDSSLHFLVRRCQELGFDREGFKNPLLAVSTIAGEPLKIDLSVTTSTCETVKVDSSALFTDGENLIDTLPALIMELQEATTLMNESESPEMSVFWKNHVIELTRRLDAIKSTSASTQTDAMLKIRKESIDNLTPVDRSDNQQPFRRELNHSMYPSENDSPLVDVISPADLPGGYHFEAEIDGQRFLATVPAGGVRKGETFACVMRELDSVAIDIPVGYWKDSMTNACRYGFFHATVWNGICCPLIALAQIGQRIQLDFLGRAARHDREQTYYSNQTMMRLVIMFWLIVNSALLSGHYYKRRLGLELSLADYSALAIINLVMIAFTIFVTQSTRYSLREKFMIREERCYDLEDLVCSTFCLPCVVCQMQRHTANYDEYQAVCCSKTGLPDGVDVHLESDHLEKSAFII